MPVFWKTPKHKRRKVASSAGSGFAESRERPKHAGLGDELLLPVLLSALAKEKTSCSSGETVDREDSELYLAVNRAVRREDDSGEFAEGRWEDRSCGNIGEDSWDYRVQGPFRAYLSYARPDFPDAPQPYHCYSIKGELSGTCDCRGGANLHDSTRAPEPPNVSHIRIPFAVQVLCYLDPPRERTTSAEDLSE